MQFITPKTKTLTINVFFYINNADISCTIEIIVAFFTKNV